MALIAKLRLSGELILFEPTFDRVPDAVCQFADFHYIERANGDTQYVFFWWMADCAPEQFEEALRGDRTVTGFERIGTVADRTLPRHVAQARNMSARALPLGGLEDGAGEAQCDGRIGGHGLE